MSRHELLFCIDPSIKAMGVAWFDIDHKKKSAKYLSSDCLTIRQGTKKDWVDRLWGMVDNVDQEIWTGKDSVVFSKGQSSVRCLVELPSAYQSETGQAASHSGATIKLAGIAFASATLVKYHEMLGKDIKVDMIPVNKWKGTVPKKITQMRVKRAWGFCPKDHNEADAVGIGDWYIRKQLKYKKLS